MIIYFNYMMGKNMSTSDIISLAQTIVLGFTAIIIIWYTYETKRIRKETKRQNMLIYEQVELLKRSQQIEEKKIESIFEPIFNWGAKIGSIQGKSIKFMFTNEGRMIKIYKIVSNNNYSIKFKPKGFINKGQEGRIEINSKQENFNRYI